MLCKISSIGYKSFRVLIFDMKVKKDDAKRLVTNRRNLTQQAACLVLVCMTGVKKSLTNMDECSIIFVSMLCVFLCVRQPRVKMVPCGTIPTRGYLPQGSTTQHSNKDKTRKKHIYTRHVKTRQRQDKTSRDKYMQYVVHIDAGLGLTKACVAHGCH